jgi:hypothetical protein
MFKALAHLQSKLDGELDALPVQTGAGRDNGK